MKTIFILISYFLLLSPAFSQDKHITDSELANLQKIRTELFLRYFISQNMDSIKPLLHCLNDTTLVAKNFTRINKYAGKQPYIIMKVYPDDRTIIHRIRYYDRRSNFDLYQIDVNYESKDFNSLIRGLIFVNEKELAEERKNNKKLKRPPQKNN